MSSSLNSASNFPSNSVEQIRREQTFPLRIKLLRPGGTIEDVSFPQDLDPTAVHFGCFRDSRLVSVATIFRTPRPEHLRRGGGDGDGAGSWQLRGMATDPSVQGMGCGLAILEVARDFVAREGGSEIWCNARVSASGFYSKFGFVNLTPEAFEVAGVGPHYVMALVVD